MKDRVAEAMKGRAEIQAAPDDTARAIQEQRHRSLEARLKDIRLMGDAVIAAFFAEDKQKARERKRAEVESWLGASPLQWDKLDARAATLKQGAHPLTPFHWEIEFPEVFGRENGGFDAMVGNPPFLGGRRTTSMFGEPYRDWLEANNVDASSNADLCSFFFRRVFDFVRKGGAFGLIATKTIAQGDTRSTGLRWICQHGGEIYAARRRIEWPGLAAVVVSVVHIIKGRYLGRKRIDDRKVETITAFLFHTGGNDDPARLARNANKSFQGSIVLGMGFTFDDRHSGGIATPLAEMSRLIEKDPRNAERIFPYIGGEEVNTSPIQAHHRYVINFGEMAENESRSWPDLISILEAKVRPERMRQRRNHLRTRWWQHAETRPALFRAIAGMDRVLVIARVAMQYAPTLVDARQVFSEQLIVFSDESFSFFA